MSDTATSSARTILTIMAGSLLLLLVLAAAAFWRLDQRVRKAGDEVVAEAQALESLRVVRPSHTASPLPGSLAQTLGPLMPELLALQKAEPPLEEPVNARCREVRDGQRPAQELPEECRVALERGRPLMQRALRASRTTEGGLPEGFHALSDPQHPHQQSGMVAILHVLKLATFEMRFQLESGQADAALEHCLDGLALSRDLGHGTGMLGALFSAAGYTNLFRPCVDALQHASPASQKQATVALRRIREGLSPASSTIRMERVHTRLFSFGRVLGPGQVEALPAGAKALVEQDRSGRMGQDSPLHMSLLMRHAFIELPRLQARIVTLVDLSLAQRVAPFEQLRREAESSWNPLIRDGLSNFHRFGAIVDQQRAQADLLLALALVRTHRAESGTWPTTLPTLYPEREVLLPTALTLQPGEAGTLVLVPEDAYLQQLSAALQPEMTPQALSLLVTP
ncbi:hypothetical protein [Archangium gephyra]|nr:hypothetical protein [Archangium gephyra]